jgi:quinol monooxygenase YgiN
MLSHNVLFSLKDCSEKAKNDLMAGCKKYLTGHPGTVFFAVGTMADDIAWEVSDRNYDVLLQIVFESKAAHDAYQDSPRHEEFFDKLGGNWKNLRSIDANVEKG